MFLIGFAVGFIMGWLRRIEDTAAQPAHQFTYTDPGSWRTAATVH